MTTPITTTADRLMDLADTYAESVAARKRGYTSPESVESASDALCSAIKEMAAERDALREVATRLLKYFPTDTDMSDLGWSRSEIDEACDAYDAARKLLENGNG